MNKGLLQIIPIIYFFIVTDLSSQNLPDQVTSEGYVFEKIWVDSLKQQESGWHFANWTFETNECEFTPSAGSFESGKLKLKIEEKSTGNMGSHADKPYWGAEYWSSAEYLYGRFVVNMKPTTPSGTVTSFFLNHIDWNTDYSQALEWYEIDIEFAGRTDQVQFTLHWIDGTGKHHEGHTVNLGFDASLAFHEWAVEWTPDFIKYYVDDQLLFTFDDPTLLSQQSGAQSIRMNYWVSDAPGWVGVFDPNVLPLNTEYDYLAYYELTNPLAIKSGIDSKKAIQYYPNPVDTWLSIKNPKWEDAAFKIFNLEGKLILEGMVDQGKINLDSKVSRGLYVIELIRNEEHGMLKFQKK